MKAEPLGQTLFQFAGQAFRAEDFGVQCCKNNLEFHKVKIKQWHKMPNKFSLAAL